MMNVKMRESFEFVISPNRSDDNGGSVPAKTSIGRDRATHNLENERMIILEMRETFICLPNNGV